MKLASITRLHHDVVKNIASARPIFVDACPTFGHGFLRNSNARSARCNDLLR